MTSSFESPRTTGSALSGGSAYTKRAEGGSAYEAFRNDVLGGNTKFDIIGGARDFERNEDVDVQELLVDLSSYPKSLSAKVKGELIRRIGLAVKKLGANVNMKTPDGIIESVKRYLPDPDEKGKTIKGDSKKLVQIATAIAKVFNETFGSYKGVEVINMSQDKRYLVRDVATHIYGLACGVNLEFYKVYSIMKDTLRKMEDLIVVLQNYYGQQSGKIERIVEKTQDPEVELIYGELSGVNAELLEHIKEFVGRMRAATSILATDENKIVLELDKHRKKFDQLTLHYDADFDTTDEAFGDQLARLLSTLDNTAVLTHVVDNSLKKVGLTMAQYKHFDKTQDLVTNILNKIERLNPDKDAKKIGDMLVHSEELVKLFNRRKKIKGGGFSENMSYGDGDSFGGSIHSEVSPIGGDLGEEDDEGIYGGARQKSPEQIAMQARVRRAELAVKAYAKELNKYINDFGTAVDGASVDLASSMYDTTKLQEAIESINVIEELRKPQMYLALAGYYVDDTYKLHAKKYKDDMLRIVRTFKEMGTKLPSARRHLDAASSAIMSILKKVDFFSDLLQTLLRNVDKASLCEVISDIPISTASAQSAMNKLYHAMHVSQMRRMIRVSAKEIDESSEKYTDLLAYTVGMRRRTLEEEKYQLLACGTDESIRKLKIQNDAELLKNATTNSIDYIWRNLYSTPAYWRADVDRYGKLEDPRAVGGAANENAQLNKIPYMNILKLTNGLLNMDASNQAAGAWKYSPSPDDRGGYIRTGGDGIAPDEHMWRARNFATHMLCAEKAPNADRVDVGPNLKIQSILTQRINDMMNAEANDEFREKHLDAFKKEVNEEFKAKQRLYKALESLDIILSTFTKELANDVDLVKEVKKFLDDTKVYTKWFTDYTGDMLSAVFESMPAFVDLAECKPVKQTWNTEAGTNYPGDAAAPWVKKTAFTPDFAGKLAVGTNTFNLAPRLIVGDNVDDPRKIWNCANIPQTGTTHDKYDPTLGTMMGEPAYSGIAEELRSPGSDSYYYKYILDKVRSSKHVLNYGKCTGVVDMEKAKETRRCISDFYDNFQALKNLFHAFITLYNRIVSGNTKVQAVMSPSQIYYAILSYLKQSALARKDHKAMYGHVPGETPEHLVTGTPQRSTYITKLAGLVMPAYYPEAKHCQAYSGCLFDAANNWGQTSRTTGDYVTGGAGLWDDTYAQDPNAAFVAYAAAKAKGAPLPVLTPQQQLAKDPITHKGAAVPAADARGYDSYKQDFYYDQSDRNFKTGHKEGQLDIRARAYYTNTSQLFNDYTFGTYRKESEKHFHSVYALEDRLCAMGIKSIVSSVLSCMGLFYVTQQPVNMGVMYSTRSILGGALRTANPFADLSTSEPAKVSEGALESYFYITRMAEFYRILFSRQARNRTANDTTAGACDIRYPMDLNGTFGKIMYIVAESGGNYTEEDVRILINETNRAYYQHKSTEKVLEAFVSEINRRYSCLVDDEAQKKMYMIEDRLKNACGEMISDPVTTFNRVTGSLDFDDEDSIDRKAASLDGIATPSDAMGKTLNRYINACNDEELFSRVDDRYTGRTRAEAKYKLDDKMKLYLKLRNLRSTLDGMFDDYLKQSDSTYPMTTDKYNRTYFYRYLERERRRFEKEGKNPSDRYAIARDLIMNKSLAEDVTTDVTADTMLAFTETGLTMLDSVAKTRVLIDALVKDIAIWSGSVFYDAHASKSITGIESPAGAPSLPKLLLTQGMDIWYRNVLQYINDGKIMTQATLAPGAAIPLPNNNAGAPGGAGWYTPQREAWAAEVGWFNGTPTQESGAAGFGGVIDAADPANVTLSDIFGNENDDAKTGKGIYDIMNVYKLYNVLIATIIRDLGGLRLLGMGVDYRLEGGSPDGGVAVIKDSIMACFTCNCDYVPHVIAYRKLRSGFRDNGSRDVYGQRNRRAQFIGVVYEEIIKRFELSPIFATMIGTCSRLSSAMGNLVTVTVSSQGTHMDMSQLQNMLVDCLSYVKQYTQQFYDAIPAKTRTAILSKDDKMSIYYNESKLTNLFESHISDGVKYPPVMDVANSTMSQLHAAMINDYQTLYTSDKIRGDVQDIKFVSDLNKLTRNAVTDLPLDAAVVRSNYGGNAIISALVPSHAVPTKINPANVRSLAGDSLFTFILGARAGQADRSHGPMAPAILGEPKNFNTLFILDDFSSCNHISSLIPALNYGVKTMLNSFFDYGNQKIYQGLIDKILSTKLQMNVDRLESSYPDIFHGNPDGTFTGSHVNYAMPHRDALLTTSNAVMLREIYQSVNARTQAPSFMFPALSDIKNTSLIDVFRLKLPMLREYYLRIINKCKMIRAFLTKGCGSRQNKKHMIKVMCPWARVLGGNVNKTCIVNVEQLPLPTEASNFKGEIPLDARIDMYGMTVSRRSGPVIMTDAFSGDYSGDTRSLLNALIALHPLLDAYLAALDVITAVGGAPAAALLAITGPVAAQFGFAAPLTQASLGGVVVAGDPPAEIRDAANKYLRYAEYIAQVAPLANAAAGLANAAAGLALPGGLAAQVGAVRDAVSALPPKATSGLMRELEPIIGRGTIPDLQFYRMSDEELYAYFMDVVSNVEDVSYELASTCDSIYKEFVTDDKFMMPEDDYAEKRRGRFDTKTYTPLSLLTIFTSPSSSFNELHSLETHRGTIPFKIQYGAKGILYSDNPRLVNDRYLEGPINVMKDANTGSKVHIDISKYGNFAKRLIDLVRFNFSLIDYSEVSAVVDGDYKSAGFRGGGYVDRPLIGGAPSLVSRQIQFLMSFNHLPVVNTQIPFGQNLIKLPYDRVKDMIKEGKGGSLFIEKDYYTGSSSCYSSTAMGLQPYTPERIQSKYPKQNPHGLWIIEWFIGLIMGQKERGNAFSGEDEMKSIDKKLKAVGKFRGIGPANESSNAPMAQLIGYTKVLNSIVATDDWQKNRQLVDLVNNHLGPAVFDLLSVAKAAEVKAYRGGTGAVSYGAGTPWGGVKTLEAGHLGIYEVSSIAGPTDDDELTSIQTIVGHGAPAGAVDELYHFDGVQWRYVFSPQIAEDKDKFKTIVGRINVYVGRLAHKITTLAWGQTAAVIAAIAPAGAPAGAGAAAALNANDQPAPNDVNYYDMAAGLDAQYAPRVGGPPAYGDALALVYDVNIGGYGSTTLRTTLGILAQNLVTELGIVPLPSAAGVNLIPEAAGYTGRANISLLQIANLLVLRDSIINEKVLMAYYSLNAEYDKAAMPANAKAPNTPVSNDPLYSYYAQATINPEVQYTGLKKPHGGPPEAPPHDFPPPPGSHGFSAVNWAKVNTGAAGAEYPTAEMRELAGYVGHNAQAVAPGGAAMPALIATPPDLGAAAQRNGLRGQPYRYDAAQANGQFYGLFGAKVYDSVNITGLVGPSMPTVQAHNLIGDLATLASARGVDSYVLENYNGFGTPSVINNTQASWRFANSYKGEIGYKTPQQWTDVPLGALPAIPGQPIRSGLFFGGGGGSTAFSNIFGGATNSSHQYSLLNYLQNSEDYIPELYTADSSFTMSQVLEIIDGESANELKQIVINNLHTTKDPICNRGSSTVNENDQLKTLIKMIIELNINPINVHSMQRFIPFANIYNYSYTLDRYVYTTYNVSTTWATLTNTGDTLALPQHLETGYISQQILTPADVAGAGGHNRRWPIDPVENTKVAFIKLIMDPYAEVDPRSYGTPAVCNSETLLSAPIGQILRGYDHLGMGVPKFLSDQVLGKALLGSMYVGGATQPMGIGNVYDGIAPLGAKDAFGVAPNAAVLPDNVLTGGEGRYDPLRSIGPSYDDLTDRNEVGRTRAWAPQFSDHAAAQVTETDMLLLRYLSFYDSKDHRVKTYDLWDAFTPKRMGPSAVAPAGFRPGAKMPSGINRDLSGYNTQLETIEALREFHYEGYERFNTQLVRNVVLISNLQRFMRYSLNTWLSRAYNLVERGHKAVAAEITERRPGNELPQGPDQTYGSQVAAWL